MDPYPDDLQLFQTDRDGVQTCLTSGLTIDVRLGDSGAELQVCITVALEDRQAGVRLAQERLTFPVRCETGRVRVGAAYVDWNEVPLLPLRFLEAALRQRAQESLWWTYQSFLRTHRDRLLEVAWRDVDPALAAGPAWSNDSAGPGA